MKKFTVCQVADKLSESLLTMFLSPNHTYAEVYFAKYAESSLKGADPDDIVLIEYGGCDVFESFSEFEDDFESLTPDNVLVHVPSYTLLSEVVSDEG